MTNIIYIDPLLIVNKQIFESIQDIAVCTICTGIVIDPRQCTKCENCFCKNCIDTWCSKSYSCPFKCSDFILREPTRVIKKILFQIVITCPKNCQSQVAYEDISTHLISCKCEILDCPTCGSKVPENLIKSYMNIQELQIENKILRMRIEELELYKKNNNKENNLISLENQIFDNKNKRINKKAIIQPNIKPNNIKLAPQFIHSARSKIKYQYSCCNKEYDCDDCHNSNETHSLLKPTSLICQDCLHISNNINDIICFSCGISFAKEVHKEENIKVDVIKYKNKNIEKKVDKFCPKKK